MNATELIRTQHQEVADLFEQLDDADTDDKQEIFNTLADAIAVHSKIEEEIFYPECRRADVDDLVRESLDDHLAVKRLIADLLDMEPIDPRFDGQCRELQEEIEHHVQFEETELLPKVERHFGSRRLDDVGRRMEALAAELEERGEPRMAIPEEAEAAPPA
jgi:hypothetical protein